MTVIVQSERMEFNRLSTGGKKIIADLVQYYGWRSYKEYIVIIEASITTGKGKSNYIALDDVSFSLKCLSKLPPLPTSSLDVITPAPTANCTSKEFRCRSRGQCIPREQICNFIRECADGSDEDYCGQCNFDKDMCGLINIASGSCCNWSRVQAEAFGLTKNTTAPDADSHGSPLGFFAAISIRPYSQYWNSVIMRSPPLGATSHACKVEFYYHFNLFGGELSLYISQIGFGTKVLLFNDRTTRGKKWQFATVPIGNWPAGKVLEYHGRLTPTSSSTNFMQDAAIDNINYVNCDPKKSLQSTRPESWR